jgi:predicted RNase H-like HicB family nuclease
MEKIANLHIEKLPEGYYLATSEDIQGLVAQGRTLWETIEIARDVARRIMELQEETAEKSSLKDIRKKFDLPLVLEY